MNRRKKHFAKLRAEEIRRKPPNKAQKRNQMSTYLKNMARYKHKVVKGSETRIEESSKRAGDELEFDKSKKQKIDEHVEAEKDDDPEEEEMKKHMEIIVNEGHKGFYHLIRADGSSKRYSSMIRMLQGIDREDLETLWKLVKEKHGINRLKMNIKFRGGLLGLKDFNAQLQLLSDYYYWKDYADRYEIKD
ncbi:hypothetical protein Tco_0296189 [Tanacetum coccineum]